MSDLIYIQDAIIELVFNEETKDIKCEDMRKVLNVLKKMPSTEPKPMCINLKESIKVKLIDWGKPIGDGRPLADSEVIPRLQDIKRQIGGSYAIERAIEVLEELPSASAEFSTFSDKLWKIAYERGKAEGRKKGKWVGADSQCGIGCPFCGTPVDDFCSSIDYINLSYEPNFCPNCGADMRDSFTIPTEIIESVIGYDD